MNKDQKAVYTRLEARLKPNRDNLREEIVDQPQLYFEAGRLAVQLAHHRDMVREEQKRVTSTVFADLRPNHKTVKECEEATELDQRHIDARTTYKKASEEAALADKLEQAWTARGYLLKELAALEINEVAHEKTPNDQTLLDRKKGKKGKKKHH